MGGRYCNENCDDGVLIELLEESSEEGVASINDE